MIDMPSDARTRIGALSEGQCRRVDLGVAVVGRPEVLFLDDRPRAWIQKPAGGCGQASRTLAEDVTTVLLTPHYLDGRVATDTTPGILPHARTSVRGQTLMMDVSQSGSGPPRGSGFLT
jgi:ABC-2 type transport system ATP-binding protein